MRAIPEAFLSINLLLWVGYTIDGSAARLSVSVKTAEAHKVNALRKLGLPDWPANSLPPPQNGY